LQYLDILIKLRKVIRSINLESKKIEKQFGVSIPQLLILQYLSGKEDYRATATEIRKFINLNASTVSGVIYRLEKKGLVARVPSPNDRRASYVTLTAKAADLLKNSPTTLQEKISKRLKQLSSNEIESLARNIDLLIEIMDAEDIDAAPLITNADMSENN
jgi:DNA-binding MarR family transcriptional regulator